MEPEGSGQVECSEPSCHLPCLGGFLSEMTSATSARILPTTELMALTMSVHFMLTSFPVDINYCIKNT